MLLSSLDDAFAIQPIAVLPVVSGYAENATETSVRSNFAIAPQLKIFVAVTGCARSRQKSFFPGSEQRAMMMQAPEVSAAGAKNNPSGGAAPHSPAGGLPSDLCPAACCALSRSVSFSASVESALSWLRNPTVFPFGPTITYQNINVRRNSVAEAAAVRRPP